ncbi:MAG: hypothetical protein POH28_03770, partial [Acidocella sp.]|nr:hypothetical protein [Acidocella sp.]
KKTLLIWAIGVPEARHRHNRSFLRRFFSKKRLLTWMCHCLRGLVLEGDPDSRFARKTSGPRVIALEG